MPNEMDAKAGELSIDEMIDFLKDDEGDVNDSKTEEDKTKETKKDDKKTEEDKEDDEEEIKLKEEDEEEEKDDENLDARIRGSVKQLKKDFPDLIKKHPWVEKAIYRNNAYAEVFPTIDDAKEASEAVETLNSFKEDLMAGNIERTLYTIKQADEEAFKRMVDNYLPQLAKIDKESYFHVCANVIRTLTINMARDGKSNNNEDLEQAAALVNRYMFGNEQLQTPTNLSRADKDDEERQKFRKEREDFEKQKYETAVNDLDRRVENVLKGTINDHIDPKDMMTAYVKRNAVNDAHSALEDLIREDKSFASQLNRLWEKANKEQFSKSSLEAIRVAYLSKARVLLPTVIKKARAEALQGLGKKQNIEDKDKRGPVTPGRSTTPQSGRVKSAQDIPKGMSTLDFLNSDD